MYEAPIKDLNFVIKNLIDLGKLNKVSDYSEFSADFCKAYIKPCVNRWQSANDILELCQISLTAADKVTGIC